VQILKVPENLHADGILDLLTQPLSQVELREAGQEGERDNHEKDNYYRAKTGLIAGHHMVVYPAFYQCGNNYLSQRDQQQQQDSHCYMETVGTDILQQSLHQARIVSHPQGFFFMEALIRHASF